MLSKNNKPQNDRRAGQSRLFFAVLGCLLIVAACGIGFYVLRHWENNQSSQTVDSYVEEREETDTGPETMTYDGVTYVRKENIETVLLMGLDKYQEQVDSETNTENSQRNTQQADFISLLVMDTDTGESRILQLNRDTMVNMPVYDLLGKKTGTTYGQLALAHTYGTGNRDSCRNVTSAVSDLLGGVKIDHYISLTMDSVATINDALGGVEVEVLDDFSDVDPSLVQGETITLMGEQALTYVRSRYYVDDGSNLSRMRRQQQYLNALYDKLSDEANLDDAFLFNLIFNVSPYMVSDCSVNTLSEILDKMLGGKKGEIETIDGEAVQGDVYIEFYPDEDALTKEVISLFWTPLEEE